MFIQHLLRFFIYLSILFRFVVTRNLFVYVNDTVITSNFPQQDLQISYARFSLKDLEIPHNIECLIWILEQKLELYSWSRVLSHFNKFKFHTDQLRQWSCSLHQHVFNKPVTTLCLDVIVTPSTCKVFLSFGWFLDAYITIRPYTITLWLLTNHPIKYASINKGALVSLQKSFVLLMWN